MRTPRGAEGIEPRKQAFFKAIQGVWQAGAISQDTMFELFRRGEILPDGRTNQDEAALIGKKPKTAD